MSNGNLQTILQQQNQMLMMVMAKSGMLDEKALAALKKNKVGIPQSDVFVKHHTDALFNEAEFPYNDDSFFFDCNLQRPVFNQTIQPMASFLAMLPVRPTANLEVSYSFLTDYDTENVGDLPIEPCDEPQSIESNSNFCKMRFPLGRHDKKTKTMELDRLIAESCANKFDDFYFLGNVRGSSLFPRRAFNPRSRSDRDLIVRGAVNKQIQYMAREHQKWLIQKLWSGDPTNNTAGGGYREPIGLLHLINDDYPGDPLLSQYLTSQSGDLADCEPMNSDCKIFNDCVCSPTASPSLWSLMQELEEVIWQRAFQSGMLPARWVWVMNPVIWEQLTKCLPCQMATDGCVNIGDVDENVRVNFDINNLGLRQEMRSSRTLMINGRRYPVVIDHSLPYNQTGTETQSKILFIPLSLAGEQVLWVEHMDYRRIAPMLRALPNTVASMLGWTDGGRFHMVLDFIHRCFQILSKIEPRIIFLGSRFAGCIDQVKACTLQNRENYWAPDGAVVPPII